MMLRFLFFVFLLLLALTLPAQDDLRVVTASLHWPHDLQEITDFEFHGCCRGNNGQDKRASSTLASQNGHHYGVDQLADNDIKTAWVEAAQGDGVKEFLRFKLPYDKAYRDAADGAHFFPNAFYLANGYQKSQQAFLENNRVRRLKMYVNGVAFCYLDLLDQPGVQILET
ncbi:MAG: hypothetical protein AAGA62_18360, partial [Bacteroidota bacterium]